MERLIVDGYNVVHAWTSLKHLASSASLEAARDKLIERLSVLGLVSGDEVTVVFDAHHSASLSNSEDTVEGVRVGCFPDLYAALATNPPDQVITL